MTTAIPVQIGEDEFASMNQARLYLTEILHSYPIGAWLSEVDSAYVRELLPAQSPFRVGSVIPPQFQRAEKWRLSQENLYHEEITFHRQPDH